MKNIGYRLAPPASLHPTCFVIGCKRVGTIVVGRPARALCEECAAEEGVVVNDTTLNTKCSGGHDHSTPRAADACDILAKAGGVR